MSSEVAGLEEDLKGFRDQVLLRFSIYHVAAD
jgi:hypothetical protein